jgi:hypothetical protein
MQIICKVITGWRPTVPEDAPPAYVELMTACWCARCCIPPF